MVNKFKLDLIASDHVFFSGECDELVFPGLDGYIGVLPNHQPTITCISAGEIRFRVGDEWHNAIVSVGFVEIMPKFVNILADSIENPEDIDIKRAEAAKERAEERLRQKLSIKQYYHTQAALSRAMTRLKFSGRHNISSKF